MDREDSTPTQEYGAFMLLSLLFIFLFCAILVCLSHRFCLFIFLFLLGRSSAVRCMVYHRSIIDDERELDQSCEPCFFGCLVVGRWERRVVWPLHSVCRESGHCFSKKSRFSCSILICHGICCPIAAFCRCCVDLLTLGALVAITYM